MRELSPPAVYNRVAWASGSSLLHAHLSQSMTDKRAVLEVMRVGEVPFSLTSVTVGRSGPSPLALVEGV